MNEDATNAKKSATLKGLRVDSEFKAYLLLL